MNKLNVSMNNCYGIKRIEKEFDFSKKKSFIIYASNGLMKTSFAKSFKVYSEGKQPIEEVHGNPTIFSVKCSDGSDLDKDNVFVIESYDENFGATKVSNLLAKKELQEQYYNSINNIENKKQEFIDKIKLLIGKKANVEFELSDAFDRNPNDFLVLLEELCDSDISNKPDSGLDFNEVSYLELFDKKVEDFVNDPKNLKLLAEYAKNYDALISSSNFLEKGLFSHYNASKVTEALGSNGYFQANHKLVLKNGQVIESVEEFQSLLDNEKKAILTDKTLNANFKKIDSALDKNPQMRGFRLIVEKDLTIIPELVNFKELKKKAWIGILKANLEILNALAEEYKRESNKIKNIIELANKENEEWREVVDIFIRRFHVPFKVSIGNQQDVILKDSVPVFKFSYVDSEGESSIDRSKLISILSGGEKRALYLMNIIFEIEALKKERKPMLIVADDIAESFDYKNKYAIIEYLKENIECNYFNFIILTHNFDFYRTVSSRIVQSDRNHCLMAIKQSDGIELKMGEYLGNVFRYWKSRINTSDTILLACIPFIRNMIEYTKGQRNPEYMLLTSLLHLKLYDDEYKTSRITFSDLQGIFNGVWTNANDFSSSRESDLVYTRIIEVAERLCSYLTNDDSNLENKIVLSMATRLVAEEIMINAIISESGNIEAIKQINSYQTGRLLGLYKALSAADQNIIKLVDEVLLMTSENIHLNSFMYEPLIDISTLHLKELFEQLVSLRQDLELVEEAE